MRRIGLVVHGSRTDAVSHAAFAVKRLTEQGVAVAAEDDAAEMLGAPVVPFSQVAQPPEVLLSLGGDGTLLRGVQWAIAWHAPLMGINLGHVGFLADAEPDGLEEVLSRLIAGDYATEERELLDIRLSDGKRYLALNDAVVSRGGYSRLITLDALVGDDTVGRFVADGLIVATPTGSTGYSLSAGGPVVSPAVDCMVITPICAHSLQHRPTVVPGDAVIRLRLCCDEEQQVSLQVDGQNCATLRGDDAVEIRRAEEQIRLIRMKSPHFFRLVREKLTEWSR